ncbi:MAG TPA: thiamine pyrophosphate-dependent enzyme, partial [Actinomycetota bacterium]|nr:thiamine pyrophosphate-dependent enzyme [Actinomycetota bacterium]
RARNHRWQAERPLLIAGGGVVYSDATPELEALAEAAGIPVAETFAGKGAVQRRAWWLLGGIGLEGTPATNDLARQADLVLTVGSRLTDFATASQSLFQHPQVRFASINLNPYDAGRLGATGIVADAKRALGALAEAVRRAGITSPADWQERARARNHRWQAERAAALDPDTPFDPSTLEPTERADTGAVLTQGQLIGLLQEHARAGDVIIAAAGGPPGDLQKVWDATEGRLAHLEFGFSCMVYEVPAAIGVRLAEPDPARRVLSFLGDGTFLMAPSELVTAAQEGLAITVVIPENRGYQVIHRLQMLRSGREFGNEFRYRDGGLDLGGAGAKPPRLEGDYLDVDLVKVAEGLGARAVRATTADEVRAALAATRDHRGPVVIVVPAIPHADLPGAGVWWDVAPAEVAEQEAVARLRAEYEDGLATQRWHG